MISNHCAAPSSPDGEKGADRTPAVQPAPTMTGSASPEGVGGLGGLGGLGTWEGSGAVYDRQGHELSRFDVSIQRTAIDAKKT
jgi:hypothetical protein